MGSIYKRGTVWWYKIYNHGECIRKSTKEKDKHRAEKKMEQVQKKLVTV